MNYYLPGCDVWRAPITLNTSFFAVYSGDKMQSLSIHEFGHATGQTRGGGASEVNDGCTLRTIMQQADSCRWDTKGIKSLTETHDLSDYNTVYGPQ